MDARTAESHFKEADSLYRDGRYDEALDRLIELDEAFPHTPNVLFPLARCLRHLGRTEESLAICDDLITRCGDLRALGLREFIRKSHSPETGPTPQPQVHSIEGLNQDVHVGVLDDLLGPPSELPPALPKPEGPKPYKKYALIGGGILLAAIVIALPLVMRPVNAPATPAPRPAVAATTLGPGTAQPDGTGQSQPAELSEEEFAAQAAAAKRVLVLLVVVLIVVVVTANTAALYLTLMIAGKLPYETVLDNLINTGFMAVALSLINLFLPCIGLAPSFYLLYKSYEFSAVNFLTWIGMNMAVGFALGLVARIILAAAGVPLG